MLSTPFYFTRGGDVNLYTGSLRDVGDVGYYWSSVATTIDPDAYHLGFNSSETRPSSSNARGIGFSVQKSR